VALLSELSPGHPLHILYATYKMLSRAGNTERQGHQPRAQAAPDFCTEGL
jgi:hypothetical protein